MKPLNVPLIALFLFSCITNSNAQDKINPWPYSLGLNSIDFSKPSVKKSGAMGPFDIDGNDVNLFLLRLSKKRVIH